MRRPSFLFAPAAIGGWALAAVAAGAQMPSPASVVWESTLAMPFTLASNAEPIRSADNNGRHRHLGADCARSSAASRTDADDRASGSKCDSASDRDQTLGRGDRHGAAQDAAASGSDAAAVTQATPPSQPGPAESTR